MEILMKIFVLLLIAIFALYIVLYIVGQRQKMNKGLCASMGCKCLIKKKKSKKSKDCYYCYNYQKNVEDVRCVECGVFRNHFGFGNSNETRFGEKITQAVWDFWHGI